MVRNYKAKKNARFDSGIMIRAVQEVMDGGKIRSVARDLKIDRMTLTRYVKKCKEDGIPPAELTSLETNMRPLPKKKHQQNVRKYNRRRCYTRNLTSTPEKNHMIELRDKRNRNEEARENKLTKQDGKVPRFEMPIDQMEDKEDASVTNIEPVDEPGVEPEVVADIINEIFIGCYVIVKLIPVNSTNARHYVAEILAKHECDDIFRVRFYRQSPKYPGKFIRPDKEDISEICTDNIVKCLPEPISDGPTKRIKSMLTFAEADLGDYSCV